ncbi:MAG: HTTM domain-containing protein [Haloarculaceae archaeon]
MAARASASGSGSGSAARLAARARDGIARRVRVDARALAAVRAGLGGLVLVDLWLRSRDLVAFYTDAGALPRALLAERFPALARLSVHALGGGGWFQGALFVIAGAAALALVAGYRTTLAAVVTWLLVVSLHARNPVLLNGGDSLLRRLLLWSLFLPLGERWSVDALRRERAPRAGVASLATGAFLLQVVLVYATNAVFKLRGSTWTPPGADAMAYVFGLDRLTVRLGDVLAAYPALYEPLGHLWLVLIVASPLLVLATGRTRTLLAGALICMHLGMALTMRLGVFPLVSVTGLVPFLPGRVWDAVETGGRAGLARAREALGASGTLAGWRARLARSEPATLPESVARARERAVPVVVAGLLVAVLVWNGMALGYVEPPAGTPPAADPVNYRWDMFAPSPPRADVWFVAPARTASGERVDALGGGRVRWQPPPDVADAYPSTRWMIYLLDLRRAQYASLRPALAEYLCDRYARRHGERLERVAVDAVIRPTFVDEPGPAPIRRTRLVERRCRTSRG